MKKVFHSLSFLALALIFCGQAFSTVTTGSDGWTIITPSADSRLVYVSNSEGNDANDGLSPLTPKQTIIAGNALIRDGYPDHLLLKRGDVFPPEADTLLGRWKNGRSAQEPVVLSYYGNSGARPVVKISDQILDHNIQTRNYQAFIGIEVYKSVADPASGDFTNTNGAGGMRFLGGGSHILIEDCHLRFMQVTVQSTFGEGNHQYTDFRFRRNIVTDSWRHTSSSSHDNGRVQGMYADGLGEGYVIEENLFDHCGWNASISGAGANMYNHNVYIQQNCGEGGIIRGNIFARGSAQGLQARSGGLVDRNLFVLNSVGFNVGYDKQAPSDPDVYTFPNRAKENVVLNGRRQDLNSSSEPQSGAVWGIWCTSNLPGVLVEDNIVANRVETGGNDIAYNEMETATMVGNISYAWYAPQDTFDSSWPHPSHDLGDYYDSIGGSDDTIAYLNWLRNRPLRSLPWDMTAYAGINYIRAGFNKSAVDGYFNYNDNAYVSVTGISVNPATINLPAGSTVQFSATITPANATHPSTHWISSNTYIATVDASGLVTAVAAGNATITAITLDGSYVAQATVNVTTPASDLLSFNDFSGDSLLNMPNPYVLGTYPANVWYAWYGTCPQCSELIVSGGDTFARIGHGTTNGTFQVVGWPGDGDIEIFFDYIGSPRLRVFGGYTGDTINSFNNGNTLTELGTKIMSNSASWTNDSYFLNLTGDYDFLVIRFHDISSAARLDNVYADFVPDVVVPVSGVSVSPASLELEIEQTSQLTATVSPSNAADSRVSWVSSNTSVATVSSTGFVTAVAPGSATITGTTVDGSFTDQTYVIVNQPPSSGEPYNVAEGKTVTASSWQDNVTGYQPPAYLVDGDISDPSRWSAVDFPQWAVIDLGDWYNIEEFNVYPYQERAYQYTIETSLDGTSYTEVVDRSGNTESDEVLADFVTVTARYVRITVTGASVYTGPWVSLKEIEVYGKLWEEPSNISSGKSVSASSWQDNVTGYQPPSFLVDDDISDPSRWSALDFPQWAIIDLGDLHWIEEFYVYPYQQRAYQYTIEASADGVSYTLVVDRSGNTEGDLVLADFASIVAQYVRITVTGASVYTGPWVSIKEIELYGTLW